MTNKRKLGEVFKTVGLPPYTYVKPRHFDEVRADIEQTGKHVLIEGPSGIGKTCVVYKVFEELGWAPGKEFILKKCRDVDAEETINRYLDEALAGVVHSFILVADDFHILTEDFRREVGPKLKRISDMAFEQAVTAKLILIGIPASGTSILENAGDLGPRLGTYRVSRASDEEIDKLIDEGEEELNILIDGRESLLAEASGNFWLAQYICNKICSTQGVHETRDDTQIVKFTITDIRQRLMSDLRQRFMPTAITFAKGKKWRPGGNKPYLEILIALAKTTGLSIPFDSVLSVVEERRRPGIKAVKGRIKEVVFNPEKKVDLRSQLAFEESYFSIEDPLFRYFLSHLDEETLLSELGVKRDNLIEDGAYSYDLGFSFAGCSRSVVEKINALMKDEDFTTFYDFDQQAFLLAQDLQETLRRVYSEACRYYLVFLEKDYLDRTWTRFEKDILTRKGRKDHIIPVLLDERVHGTVVGIPSDFGLIDLSAEWKALGEGASIDDITNALKAKIVTPLTEKLSTRFQEV